jgi:hypothetical protein
LTERPVDRVKALPRQQVRLQLPRLVTAQN